MRPVLFLVLMFCCVIAGAQITIQSQPPLYTDFRALPVPARPNYNVEGSPFLIAEYCKANIKVQKGKLAEGVMAKVNLKDNAVYFKSGDETEMIATIPIEYIEFTGCTEGRSRMVKAGFPEVDKNTAATYYEVLSDGPVKLLKGFIITYQDQMPYNSPEITRTYRQVPQYYGYSTKAGMIKLTDPETALTLLAEHKDKAGKFINDEKIKFKKEADLIKLITYYNTL